MATWGNTVLETGSFGSVALGGRGQFTPGSNQELTKIWAALASGGSGNVRVCVYQAATNVTNGADLLYESGSVACSAGFNEFVVPGLPTLINNYYISIVAKSDGEAFAQKSDTPVSDFSVEVWNNTIDLDPTVAFDDPAAASWGDLTRDPSIYMEYEATASGLSIPIAMRHYLNMGNN